MYSIDTPLDSILHGDLSLSNAYLFGRTIRITYVKGVILYDGEQVDQLRRVNPIRDCGDGNPGSSDWNRDGIIRRATIRGDFLVINGNIEVPCSLM